MRRIAVILGLAVLVASCTRPRGPERVPTVSVAGTVLIDGEPAPGVSVTLHRLDTPAGEAGVYTARPSGLTDDTGRFALSTYEQGDGIAAGEYVATFQKLKYDAFRNRRSGPDKLRGKYSDAGKSSYKVIVTGDEEPPVEIGPFELQSPT